MVVRHLPADIVEMAWARNSPDCFDCQKKNLDLIAHAFDTSGRLNTDICLSNIRQTVSSTVDKKSLKRPKVCISFNPGLLIHPRQNLLKEGDLVGITVLELKFGDPDRLQNTYQL